MTKYYVKPDTDGKFPDKDIAPALEMADGLVEVSIPTTSIQYFTRYWWMYALLGNGKVQAPGNLPDLSIDGLQSIIDQQGSQIETQADQLKQYDTLLPEMQKMLVSSSKAQAESAATQDQFKTMMVEMSKTLAQMQSAQSTAATANK